MALDIDDRLPQDIDKTNLSENRKLDAKIARVLGWFILPITDTKPLAGIDPKTGLTVTIPAFSTDPVAAWQAIEELDLLNDYLLFRNLDSGKYALCEKMHYPDWMFFFQADTMPMAVCQCVLAKWKREREEKLYDFRWRH